MKRFNAKHLVTACALIVGTTGTTAIAGDITRSDTWSKASLTTTYTLNRHLNPFKIDVDVHDGLATLQGDVDSNVERDLAEELALGVDGIRKVDNQLRIVSNASERSPGADSEPQGRSFMRTVEDANITAKVKSQLLWNSNTNGLNMDVDTHNGVVTLSGEAASAAEAELAAQIARNTRDVQDVENRLHVNTSDSKDISEIAALEGRKAKQTVSDGWITAKVKSALLYNRTVDGTDIDVDTENGVVTLRGKVDSDFEKRQAVSISSGIKGVVRVNDQLTGS